MHLPLDLRLALSPIDTYHQLMAEPVRGTWRRALERPMLIALMVGVTVSMSSAWRVELGLVVMGVISWSFVILIQLAIGATIIRLARGRPMSMPRCIELLFVGHLPWSLWMLMMAGLSAFTTLSLDRTGEVLSLVIPAVWTTVILFAFCRTVLGCSTPRARLLTVVHQAITWTTFVGYGFLTTGIWGRVLAAIGA